MTVSRRHAYFGLFSLLVFLVSHRVIGELVRFSLDLDNKEASQVLIVPVIAAVMIWTRRREIFADQPPRRSAPPLLFKEGSVVIGLVGAILLTTQMAKSHFNENDYLALRTFCLILSWLGGFVLFYGRDAFRAAAFPLLFLFGAVPIPSGLLDWLIATLQSGSADIAYGLLRLSGTPIYREGVQFAMPGLTVEVAPECSGIRSAIALSIAAILAAHLFLRSRGKQALLLLTIIPVVFFKNALRIAVLTLLAVHIDKRILTSRLHQEGGIPFFILGLLMIYPVLITLVKSERFDRRFSGL
jgi:exosortase